MTEEQDRAYIRSAEAALDALFEKYSNATPAEKWHLKPAISKAAEALLDARLSLFREGTLIAPEDMQVLQEVKAEIDAAADAQATILSAIKLAALLGAFA